MDEQEEKQAEAKRSLLVVNIQNRKEKSNVLYKMWNTKSG